MSKGNQKREMILKAALDFTSQFGLEGLSIGVLAKKVGMSKSGLFGHFKSKEKLQIMVIDFAAQHFTDKVIRPAIKKDRGLPRLIEMMNCWEAWSERIMKGGCPIFSAAIEFDDRPGVIRNHIQKKQSLMIATYEKAIELAVHEGHLTEEANPEQIAFELYSNMLGYHMYSRLLKDKKSSEMFKESYTKILKPFLEQGVIA